MKTAWSLSAPIVAHRPASCRWRPISLATWPTHGSRRSEERRVGKECRYRRDWSSDVCSSDLYEDGVVFISTNSSTPPGKLQMAADFAGNVADTWQQEIGRASCRERV